MAEAFARPFPWQAVMAFGLGTLKLAPRDFWAMTPREIAAAMRAHGIEGRRPMTGAELEGLMRAFPDAPHSGTGKSQS